MILFIIYILGAVFAAFIAVETYLYKAKVVYLSEIIACLILTVASWLSVVLWSIGCLGDFIIYQKKTNGTEMPSKIYFDGEEACEQPVFAQKSIEYVHKDAFVDRACKWFNQHYRDYMHNPTGKKLEAFFGADMIADFKKYMED